MKINTLITKMTFLWFLVGQAGFATEETEWEEKLEANYQQLIKQLGPADQGALKEAQQKWVAFKEAEFSVRTALNQTDKVDLVKNRAETLKNYWYDLNPEEMTDTEEPIEDDHPISKTLSACLDSEANDSELTMQTCYSEATTQWDKELNRLHEKALKKLDKTVQPKLQEAQQKWLQFKEAETKAIQRMNDDSERGTIQKVYVTTNLLNLIEERARMFYCYLDE